MVATGGAGNSPCDSDDDRQPGALGLLPSWSIGSRWAQASLSRLGGIDSRCSVNDWCGG